MGDLIRLPGLKLPPCPKDLREAVLEAFEGECAYCLRSGQEDGAFDPDGHPWHIDRILPGALGGRYIPDNVTLACRSCNLRKSADPSLVTSSLVEMWQIRAVTAEAFLERAYQRLESLA